MTIVLPLGLVPIAASSMLFGLGLGTTMPAAQTIAQWAGGKARLGVSTATLSFARSVGGVVGTAGTAAILLAAIDHYAPGSETRILTLLDGIGASAAPQVPRQAINASFQIVFGAIAVMALVATLLAASIPQINLDDPEPPQI